MRLVRRELEWAYEVDKDHPLRFDVGPVELDVTVEATRATNGGGHQRQAAPVLHQAPPHRRTQRGGSLVALVLASALLAVAVLRPLLAVVPVTDARTRWPVMSVY